MRSATALCVVLLALAASGEASAAPQLVHVTSPVHRGSYASISVRAGSHTFCSIKVHFGSGAPLTAAGLGRKGGALFTGLIEWRWLMSARSTRGRWTIDVSCGTGGSLRTTFLVT